MPVMVELPRFFLAPGSLDGDDICITGEPFHHLAQVLRLQAGDRVLLLDGAGICCQACITAVARHSAAARIQSRWCARETALSVLLLQALPKGEKFDLVLQKGTELGIDSFQPVLSERSIPRLTPERLRKRVGRWSRIISEAARQSRRSILPELGPLQPLTEALPGPADRLRLVLWEMAETALAEALPEQCPSGISLLVGPEGGFAPAEITFAQQAGYQAVHLGPRILRTETAGLAAAAILQYRYGDLDRAPQPSEETP